MIGLVVVSHSRALGEAVVALAAAMVSGGERPALVAAAGLDDGSLGTDAGAVAEAIAAADSGDGVLVLVDLGSAVLSAEMATEFLAPDAASRVRVSPAPLVEGLVAAVVAASGGADLDRCDAEARRGLAPKEEHLAPAPPRRTSPQPGGVGLALSVDLPHGLHARPAAAVALAVSRWDAEVVLRNARTGAEVDAGSAVEVMALGLQQGDTLQARASGPEAGAALAALQVLADAAFGEARPGDAETAPSPTGEDAVG